MTYPCKSCPGGKTGKRKENCSGCDAWRQWFRLAWPEVCRRVKRAGKKGRPD